MKSASLPSLPLEEWEATKITLHLYAQVVGKIRLRLMPKRNHWWHVPLYVTSRGWTTGLMPYGDRRLEIAFDFIEHQLRLTTVDGVSEGFALRGQSVAEFYGQLFGFLRSLGMEIRIQAIPYDLPFRTPFAEDREHASYDREYVNRFWRILSWTSPLFWEFAGRWKGKTSPVHMFWHSFDLAVTLFSGRRGPDMPGANNVAREAYTHEVISFGFWAGDANVREAAFYSYAWPEPEGLRQQPLSPAAASWVDNKGSSMALLPYREVVAADDPKAVLLGFMQSAFDAGAQSGHWNEK